MTAVLDGRSIERPHPAVLVEDNTVVVMHYDGIVRAGVGAIVYAASGVVVDPQAGSEVHLAQGAYLEESPAPGAMESLEVSVVPWDGADLRGGSSRLSIVVDEPDGPRELVLTDATWPGAA